MATRDEFEGFVLQAAYDAWKTQTPPAESVETLEDEDQRERDWDDVVAALRDFAETRKHGWPAAVRALAEAMNPQRTIFRG